MAKLQLDDLAALDVPLQSQGTPFELALDLIDEDPEQPRVEFDEPALLELASTIGSRGVRQPVSVRPHPSVPGRWMLNFGARRLRASRMAGRTSIPAFEDRTVDRYDQVIENEQREGLTPLALALFVQRRLGLGENQADIARRLGKSRGYLTLVCALIDAPDWLMDLYRSGRCTALRELYELRRLGQVQPEPTLRWAQDQRHIGRSEVRALRALLGTDSEASPSPAAAALPPAAGLLDSGQGDDSPTTAVDVEPGMHAHAVCRGVGARGAAVKRSAPPVLPVLRARFGDQMVVIDLTQVPTVTGKFVVRAIGATDCLTVDAASLRLCSIESTPPAPR